MAYPAKFVRFGLALLLCASTVIAQEPETTDTEGKEEEEQTSEESQFKEVVVVTASRTEQPLHEVPAAMTVLSSEQIEQIPADDYGDYLRNVPGLNVSQMSARDIQITGRQATSSLATSQLVLLDNRTIYLDFFGFVIWDFVPLDPKEIKQIEVVRGPGSAVWGANALTGVINLITKPPKEIQGTTVTLGAGELSTGYASVTHAGVKGKLGYKIAGSYYEQDPYDRPTGTIPDSAGPTNPGGTPYPPFKNQGTEQPKLNLRFDFDRADETTWGVSAGYAGTDGIIHTGLGPFDIDSGTFMSYAKVDWTRRAARVTFFVNDLDGDADNLLTVGPTGAPLAFSFESQTYNLDFSNTTILGDHHVLTYGANARHNDFDLSIAPGGDDRDEIGVFLQDEIRLGDKVRWLVGARVDDIDPIDSVFSPRTSLLISPTPNHTFRASYNRAFRAPSLINNFLTITIVNPIDLTAIYLALGLPVPMDPIFPLFSDAVGNPDLQEERLDAAEVGYVGSFGNRTTLTVSVYRNELTDSTDFFQASAYTGSNPPPGWGTTNLPTFILDLPPLAGALPATFSYRNIGEIVDKGVEVSVNFRPSSAWSVFFNYSYQDEPDVEGIDTVVLPNGSTVEAINIPPEHRANAGVAYNGERFFANGNVNYWDEAFWTDVLDSRFWGPTDDFTQVSVSAGVRFRGDAVTLSVTGQNIFDEDVQQHVFGDIISRKVTGQLLFRF